MTAARTAARRWTAVRSGARRPGATRADASHADAGRPGLGRAGLALAVVSAAAFSTSGAFASALINGGWSPAAAVLARITLAAFLLTIPALIQLRGRWRLLRRGAGQASAFGLLAVAGAQLCYFNAIERIPVGVALMLEYLGTVLVVGWLWLRHGQRPRRLTVGGAVIAFTGLAMVLNLTGSAGISPIGVMWGLLAAVGLAFYFVISADESKESLPPVVMAWAGLGTGAIVLAVLGLCRAFPLIASASDVTMIGHRVSWALPVAGLSVIAAVLPYVAGIGAARRLGAKLASFVGLSEVLFAVLFAWLLLGQLPALVQFAGGALILAGVIGVRVDELRGGSARQGRVRYEDIPERDVLADCR
ncbi:MAG TPA: EamA family transporter [Streptosporangiaceae bacterium]|nr:EamA family transporter [Streptosporangiaceae bacterium]